MSRSLDRVERALRDAGVDVRIVECSAETRTAAQAAAAAGAEVDQIVKSIVFRGEASGALALFLTAGANRVDPERASAVAGETLGKADADFVRATTGFAIGGVAPVGHVSAVRSWFDPRLLDFDLVWAAAGTPRHIFAIPPRALLRVTGASTAAFTT